MTDKPSGVRLAFKVKSDPFLGEPEGASDFYAAVGRMLMVWGRFETNPDFSLRAIFGLPDPEAVALQGLEAGRFPLSRKRKAGAWREAFKTVPRLESRRKAALDPIARATITRHDRCVVAHSTWQGFASGKPPTVKTCTHRYQGKTSFGASPFSALIGSSKR